MRKPDDYVRWRDVGVPGGVARLDETRRVVIRQSRVWNVNGNDGEVSVSSVPAGGRRLYKLVKQSDNDYDVVFEHDIHPFLLG